MKHCTACKGIPSKAVDGSDYYEIACCNLHSAADELLEAAKMAHAYFGENIRITPSQIAAKLSEAIEKAEGKE